MKTKRYFLVFLASALLLITLVSGCVESYTPEDLDTAREAGYSEGYASGKTEGYTEGHDEGYNTGKVDGYTAGYPEGYETGKTEGFKAGSLEGYETGKAEGHKVGYAEGYDAGIIELESAKEEAEKFGYDKGYDAGIATAQQEVQAAEQAAEAEREAAMARLDDLAYIETWGVSNYSDDANPAPNGISLRIRFYDSKSELITFTDIPLTVAIKIIKRVRIKTYDNLLDMYWYFTPNTIDYLIYEDTITKDFTGGSLGAEIRIPFGSVKAAPWTNNMLDYSLDVRVTVTTPNQGDFTDTTTGYVELPP